jgi:hypothetical protein
VNEEQNRDDFEERLLAQLRVVVRERSELPAFQARAATGTTGGDGRSWRPATRLAIGGAGVAAVAAAVLVISSGTGDTPSAFAVEPQGGGDVRVEISSLSDAKGLETALDAAGVNSNVEYLEADKTCAEGRFTPAKPTPGKGIDVRIGIRQSPSGTTFTVNRDAVGAGQTLVVTASPAADGTPGPVGVQVAEGAIGACVPVAAPPLPEPSAGGVSESHGGPGGPGLEQHFSERSAPEKGPGQGGE